MCHHPLHRDGVGLNKQQVIQLAQSCIDLGSGFPLAGQCQIAHSGHVPGGDIGGDRDVALPAPAHQLKRRGIVTGKYRETIRHGLNQSRHARHVTGRIFDRYDIVDLAELDHRLVQQITAGASRDVIENNGQVDRAGHRLKVLKKPLLSRLVVIGRHGQRIIGTRLSCRDGELDRFMGRVTARARHHRYPSPRLLDRKPDHLTVLGHRECRAFAGRAHHAQTRGARFDVVFDQAREGGPIDSTVGVHGRYQRNNASGYHRFTPAGRLGKRTAQHGVAIIHFRGGFTTE